MQSELMFECALRKQDIVKPVFGGFGLYKSADLSWPQYYASWRRMNYHFNQAWKGAWKEPVLLDMLVYS
jgi:hypothetical protein